MGPDTRLLRNLRIITQPYRAKDETNGGVQLPATVSGESPTLRRWKPINNPVPRKRTTDRIPTGNGGGGHRLPWKPGRSDNVLPQLMILRMLRKKNRTKQRTRHRRGAFPRNGLPAIGWADNTYKEGGNRMKKQRCCFCGTPLTDRDVNNADPARAGGICCGKCNARIVVPYRMIVFKRAKQAQNKQE